MKVYGLSEIYIPGPQGMIKGKELTFEVEEESWNVYKLEDGTILRVKLIATKIARGLDPETGDIFYLPLGEPMYNIRHTVVVSAQVPNELLKKPEE